jgi:hypothetical protein
MERLGDGRRRSSRLELRVFRSRAPSSPRHFQGFQGLQGLPICPLVCSSARPLVRSSSLSHTPLTMLTYCVLSLEFSAMQSCSVLSCLLVMVVATADHRSLLSTSLHYAPTRVTCCVRPLMEECAVLSISPFSEIVCGGSSHVVGLCIVSAARAAKLPALLVSAPGMYYSRALGHLQPRIGVIGAGGRNDDGGMLPGGARCAQDFVALYHAMGPQATM